MRVYILEWHNKQGDSKKTLVIAGNKTKAISLFELEFDGQISNNYGYSTRHIQIDVEKVEKL